MAWPAFSRKPNGACPVAVPRNDDLLYLTPFTVRTTHRGRNLVTGCALSPLSMRKGIVKGGRSRETGILPSTLNCVASPPVAMSRRYSRRRQRACSTTSMGGQWSSLSPLPPSGTPFQRAVWRILTAIPSGETKSYGWVAEQLGMRSGAKGGRWSVWKQPHPHYYPMPQSDCLQRRYRRVQWRRDWGGDIDQEEASRTGGGYGVMRPLLYR